MRFQAFYRFTHCVGFLSIDKEQFRKSIVPVFGKRQHFRHCVSGGSSDVPSAGVSTELLTSSAASISLALSEAFADSGDVLLSPDVCAFELLDGILVLSVVSAEALCEDDDACEALGETVGADSAGVLSDVDADALTDSSASFCFAS